MVVLLFLLLTVGYRLQTCDQRLGTYSIDAHTVIYKAIEHNRILTVDFD